LEYKKNDLKEHEKINKEKGYKYFDTKQYQGFADRILRYELTIRNGMLNYFHKRKNIFRSNCPVFQARLKEYEKVEVIDQKNKRRAQKIGSLPKEEKEKYRKEHPYEKVTKESRTIHKYVQSLIMKRTYFLLDIHEAARLYNKSSNYDHDCNAALFTKGLLKSCLDKLLEFIKEFQVKELPDEEKIRNSIAGYNSTHKKKLPESDMIWFYSNLKTIGSFKETAAFCHLSRASLYRYKDRFAKIGISQNNINPVSEFGLPSAPIDFRTYHTILTENPHFLKPSYLYKI
jgi:hypothetical protein